MNTIVVRVTQDRVFDHDALPHLTASVELPVCPRDSDAYAQQRQFLDTIGEMPYSIRQFDSPRPPEMRFHAERALLSQLSDAGYRVEYKAAA
jgi:hypothetical protein